MTAVVAERGQVTIPKPIREKMGIRPSCALSFSVKDGMLIAVKVDTSDPISRWMGCLKTNKTTDEMIEELRGPAVL